MFVQLLWLFRQELGLLETRRVDEPAEETFAFIFLALSPVLTGLPGVELARGARAHEYTEDDTHSPDDGDVQHEDVVDAPAVLSAGQRKCIGCVVGLVGCVGTVNAAGELTVLSEITHCANAAEETVAVDFARAAVLTVGLGAEDRRQRRVFAVSSGGTRLTVTLVVQFERDAFTLVEARRAPTRVCVVALSAEVAGGAEALVRLVLCDTFAAELARLAGARGRGLRSVLADAA